MNWKHSILGVVVLALLAAFPPRGTIRYGVTV